MNRLIQKLNQINMQDIKEFSRSAKYDQLYKLRQKEVELLYSGEDLPNGVVAPTTIKGIITLLSDDQKTFRFDFENPKSSNETNVLLEIDKVEAFEVGHPVINKKKVGQLVNLLLIYKIFLFI